jgi:nitrite reductase/ring-hydroxylating ferredoxin subunit
LSDGFVRALEADQLAPGGLRGVEVEGQEIVICNCAGDFHAVQRRCGHMNAPLERGTLDGTILTCAMHCAQFDVTTGEALSGPVPRDTGETLPPRTLKMLQDIGGLMQHIHTESLRTYETKVAEGAVWVRVPDRPERERQ